ncbi:phenylalanine--tRNA ligase subunit beta [Thermus filiformis]|uniref:Phenylalanine--tRNA ligase beta subunit n=1 Tax=Thermus filiformis TaxID=276 RepID=A0A0A2XB28_THEFI|nr:phenylalanine--tRNA ligase subunit beta [Thermus filiformis]KGQ22389.1 phenylalanyl-tRNA synthetase subunit beta [Thermus filiformis]
MRVPYSWLKTYLPEAPLPERLEELLAQLGFEVEALEAWPAPPEGVVFARVLEAQPIPGTGLKRLVLDIGRPVEVVSGAPNAREGIGVALALPGTEVLGERVGERRIQGVVSHGMALSPKELGVGEYSGGLLEFPPDALPPGAPVAEAWPEDTVLAVDITPNRPDALGVFGLARDLSALGLELVIPETGFAGEDVPLPFRAQVEDEEGAPHFTLSYAFGLRVGPSPLWLQRWLFAAGMRPINNVVDITNFAMLELSQSMHAFDRRRIGEGLLVRRARKGERLVTLDGVERLLAEEDLLITALFGEESVPVGLAGIMGGKNSEVQEDTEEVALEVAYFNPVRIRRTSRRLGLRTEASHRFERGVDPLGQAFAQRRALHLLEKVTGARVARTFLDLGQPQPPAPIPFRPEYTNRLLGTDYPVEVQLSTLRRLFCTVEGEGPYWVRPPSFRVDLSREEDLVEEVARVQGYETIPTTLPAFFPAPDNRNVEEAYRKKQALKTLLAGLGFQEVMPYPFTSEEEARLFRVPSPTLRLLNPQSPEKSALRTLLFPGLVRALENMLKNQEAERALLFEVGRVFQEEERTHVAGLLLGEAVGGAWFKEKVAGYYALKGLLEAVLDRMGLEARFLPKAFPWLHPGVSAEVVLGERPFGFLGQIHPEVTRALELPPLFVFELLWPFPEAKTAFRDLPRFPRATRDLAVVVPEAVGYHEVEALLKRAAGALLEGLELFDLYQGPPLEAGQKSLAFHLAFRHPERTLKDEEVDRIMEGILEAIWAKGWRIRG